MDMTLPHLGRTLAYVYIYTAPPMLGPTNSATIICALPVRARHSYTYRLTLYRLLRTKQCHHSHNPLSLTSRRTRQKQAKMSTKVLTRVLRGHVTLHSLARR